MVVLLPLLFYRLTAAIAEPNKKAEDSMQSREYNGDIDNDEPDDYDVKIVSVEPNWIGIRAHNWHVIHIDKIKHKTGYCKYESSVIPAKFSNNTFVCLSPVFKNGPVRLRFSYDKETWSEPVNLEGKKLPPPLQYLFAPIIVALIFVFIAYKILQKKRLIRRKRKNYHKLPAALVPPKAKSKRDPNAIKRRSPGFV